MNKGLSRKALLLLRTACIEDETNAGLWTQYGVACIHHGKESDATGALNHAIWLRQRLRQHRRAHVTRRLLERMDPRRSAA